MVVHSSIAVIPTCAWPKLKHLCVKSFGSRALDRSEHCVTSASQLLPLDTSCLVKCEVNLDRFDGVTKVLIAGVIGNVAPQLRGSISSVLEVVEGSCWI